MKRPHGGGGWPAVFYTFKKGREAGGILKLYRALRTRNACKACALGMGGQLGGMVNERRHTFEVCKKSIQAMAADMQGRVRGELFNDFSIEKMRSFSPRELEAAGRLTDPLYKGPLDDRYRVIPWDEAFGRVADKLAATTPDESFFYFSGRSSNEAGFLLQLFARLYGTNNVNNCSYYCHQASGVGLSSVTGSGTATVVLDDIEKCDLVLLIGANPSSNHPRLMKSLLDVRRRGGKVIVINPLREVGLDHFRVPSDWRSMLFGSDMNDLYLQPHIGGDIPVLLGIAKLVLEAGAEDTHFLRNHTDGWDEWRAHAEAASWDAIETACGLRREDLQKAAQLVIESKETIFCWAMGITHHEHGVENVRAIANLAMVRGMLGRPGCGLLPLRGHSNVQGIGSVGVTPRLKDAIFTRLQDHFGIELPTTEGLDTLGCMVRAHEGSMRFGWCLGGNLYGSNPDSTYAAEAMNSLDMVVYMNTTLNTGHAWGTARETLILPVLARDEESQPTTQESMFNYVRLSDGGAARHEGPKSEVEVIATIAESYFGADAPIDFASMRQHKTIREAIAKAVPGYDDIGAIDETRREFRISGRTFHEPTFATDNGRARFHVTPIPELRGTGAHELRLMTVRSEGQFNTVVYEDHDVYRGQDRRDVIMMNSRDIDRLGLDLDERVTVSTATGSLSNVLVRMIDIAPGNAVMYFPEANVLIPRATDAASRTPAFKNVVVEVRA